MQLEEVTLRNVTGRENGTVGQHFQLRQIAVQRVRHQSPPRPRCFAIFHNPPAERVLQILPPPAVDWPVACGWWKLAWQLGFEFLDSPGKFLATCNHLRRLDHMVRLVRVVHQGHEPIVISVCDRIILVRMTLGTACREPQPDRARCRYAVDHRIKTILQRINATLLVEHRIAVKSRRDQLILSAPGNMSPANC